MSFYERDNNMNEMDDSSDKSMEKLMDRYHQNSKNMPVKTQIRKLEELISEIRKDLGENTKQGQIARSQNMSLEHQNKEKCNQLTKSLMDDLFSFDKEFKRIIQSDKNETDFLNKQLNGLIMDKTNIDQIRVSLDNRLRICENEIGVDPNQ